MLPRALLQPSVPSPGPLESDRVLGRALRAECYGLQHWVQQTTVAAPPLSAPYGARSVAVRS
jgi:hypothetical protein